MCETLSFSWQPDGQMSDVLHLLSEEIEPSKGKISCQSLCVLWEQEFGSNSSAHT